MRPAVFQVGGVVYWTLLTRNPDTGVLKDADSTPTVAVRKNGSSVGDSVTVTKRSATTGIYDCSYNPAGEVEGDSFTMEESAAVTGTTTSSATYVFGWTIRTVRTGAVELDPASRLAIWNTLTTETFTADSFGDLLLISDGTNGRAVKVTGANHIAADVHDCQTDGLSGSTEITNIQNASGYLLAVLAGACADPQTASETYAITVFGSTFTVGMDGQTSTGTRTAPTLTKA